MTSDDPCRCPGECAYWCTSHGRHHVVPSMVEFCLERATAPVTELPRRVDPDERSDSGRIGA